MARFRSDTVRNARLDAWETAIGTAPEVRIYNGTPPADESTALSGNTLLASGSVPSDYMAAASGGVKAKTGSWTLTGQAGAGAGLDGTFYRIYQGATCHEQGSFGEATVLVTNALTAANGNVLNFASTTGIAAGQTISGAGVPPGATVIATTGTTVTMSHASTAGVANAASITFGYDMVADNQNIANGQAVTVSTFQLTEPN